MVWHHTSLGVWHNMVCVSKYGQYNGAMGSLAVFSSYVYAAGSYHYPISWTMSLTPHHHHYDNQWTHHAQGPGLCGMLQSLVPSWVKKCSHTCLSRVQPR